MYCVNKYHEDVNKCHIHNKQCRYYFLIKHLNSKFHSIIIYHELIINNNIFIFHLHQYIRFATGGETT